MFQIMDEAKSVAKQFIRILPKAGIKVSQAFLFGSHAKGNAKKDSDIDVCVISSSFSKDYLAEMVKLRKHSLKIDSRIEPVAFLPGDLNDKYSTFASEIRKYGILL